MIGVLRLRARAEWRRHWVSLVALTLLIAFAGAVVLTTVAGARRTRSAVTRLDGAIRIPNAFMVFDSKSFAAADKVLALPDVASGVSLANMMVFTPTGYIAWAASTDGRAGNQIARERLIEGRTPRRDSALEVAIPQRIAREQGVGVGDRLQVRAPSRAQARCISQEVQGPECATTNEIFTAKSVDVARLDGPSFPLRVVGITRGLLGTDDGGVNITLLPPAFYEKAKDTVPFHPAVMVRYRPGVTDQQFEKSLARAVPRSAIVDYGSITPVLDSMRSTVGVLANGLMVFAAVAALAGIVAVSQAIARQVIGGRGDRRVLSTLGANDRVVVLDAITPLVPVAIGGALLATLGAWVASSAMPLSAARRIEPHPGMSFDAAILVGGAVVLALFVVSTSAVVSVWLVSRNGATRRRAGSARMPLGAGTVPMSLGARLALDPGRGTRAVPVRSAMVGVGVAAAGLVAVLVFGSSLDRLIDTPARYGYGWDLSVTPADAKGNLLDDMSAGDQERTGEALAAEPDVIGVNQIWKGLLVSVDGRSVTGYAERPVEGESGFVIVSGRAPVAGDEVALGGKTLRRTGTAIGGDVAVHGHRFRVVGQAVFPATTDGYALADGAVFTERGKGRLGATGGSASSEFVVTLRPGAGAHAASNLAKFNQGQPPERALQPAEVTQLARLRNLPRWLGGFLIVLGLLAVGHVLVLTVRRRTSDLAVVRVLGCTPGQTSRTVAWQATTLSAVGLVVGVPLGVLLGRTIWSEVASSYGIANDVLVSWLGVAGIVLGAFVLANAIAFFPGRRVARIRPATALRSE